MKAIGYFTILTVVAIAGLVHAINTSSTLLLILFSVGLLLNVIAGTFNVVAYFKRRNRPTHDSH
jgi:uncharacterized membrane protein